MRSLLAFVSMFALSTAVAFADPPGDGGDDDTAPAKAAAPAEKSAPKNSIDLADIRTFTAVYSLVKQAYVDEVDDRRLMRAAIQGLLSNLDPHSEYLDKEALAGLTEDTTGSYAGLGLEVSQVDGTLRVIAPIDDTPAQRGGIRAGDIIVRIDGKPVQADDLDSAVARLRGKPCTSITLSVLHEKTTTPVDITLKREAIRVASVRGRLLEPGYGYIRVAAFQADTAADFERALDNLQVKSGGLRGLVVDLRSNPGGLLVSAVQIADDLLDKGDIVSTRGRTPASDTKFAATPGDRLKGAPLVLIVDAGTASAAEVLAGALHDNRRARIVGSRTFGKGSVQTLLPLDNGDSVKLTTARYYTPSGKSIQALGIGPDVVLHNPADAGAGKDGAQSGAQPGANGNTIAPVTEATLPGHLLSEEEGALPGDNAGEVLDGDAPIQAALAELKKQPARAQPVKR